MTMEAIIKNSLMTQFALFRAAIINAIPQSYYAEHMLSFLPNIKTIINTENCYTIINIEMVISWVFAALPAKYRTQFFKVPTSLSVSLDFHKFQAFLLPRFQVTFFFFSHFEHPQVLGQSDYVTWWERQKTFFLSGINYAISIIAAEKICKDFK